MRAQNGQKRVLYGLTKEAMLVGKTVKRKQIFRHTNVPRKGATGKYWLLKGQKIQNLGAKSKKILVLKKV